MGTQLPEWIEELAENWRRAARSESERAFWNEQLQELRTAFEKERAENERARRSLVEESRKAVAQSAHASLAARHVEELVGDNAALKDVQGKARDRAVAAAAEASTAAETARQVLAAQKSGSTRALADQAELLNETRQAAEAAHSAQDEVTQIGMDLRAGLERVADETRSEVAARVGAALSALEQGLTVLDEGISDATRSTARSAADASARIKSALDEARSELDVAVDRARDEAATVSQAEAEAVLTQARADMKQAVTAGRGHIETLTNEARSKVESAAKEAQATVFVVTQQAVLTGEQLKESIESSADRALDSVTRAGEIADQAERSVRSAVAESRSVAERAALQAQERVGSLVSDAIARMAEESAGIGEGAKADIKAVVEAARVACLDAVLDVRREGALAAESSRSSADAAKEQIGIEVASALDSVVEMVAGAQERLEERSNGVVSEIDLAVERAERLAGVSAREAATAAALEHIELARGEIDAGRSTIERVTDQALERVIETVDKRREAALSSVTYIGDEIAERLARTADQVEESAERAAREAAAGAVALGAQKEAALSAERSAKAADAALKAAQREAEARVTQEQAALAAESSAEASLHAAEAARAALAHSVEQIEAVINDRENAQTSFGEARTLLETALAKMDYTLGEITDMVARFGVAQAKVLDDQQQALSETQVAARAAQGAARAAQASSVAAQRDATRALKAVVAFAERDEEHTIIRLDANGHDDPAPGTDVLTPWDELAEQDGLEVDPLWAPIDELTNGERLDLYGDEEPPLLERILTKLRPDRED